MRRRPCCSCGYEIPPLRRTMKKGTLGELLHRRPDVRYVVPRWLRLALSAGVQA